MFFFIRIRSFRQTHFRRISRIRRKSSEIRCALPHHTNTPAGRDRRLGNHNTDHTKSTTSSVGVGSWFSEFTRKFIFPGFPGNPGNSWETETGLAEFEKMRTGIQQFFFGGAGTRTCRIWQSGFPGSISWCCAAGGGRQVFPRIRGISWEFLGNRGFASPVISVH